MNDEAVGNRPILYQHFELTRLGHFEHLAQFGQLERRTTGALVVFGQFGHDAVSLAECVFTRHFELPGQVAPVGVPVIVARSRVEHSPFSTMVSAHCLVAPIMDNTTWAGRVSCQVRARPGSNQSQ